MSGSAKLDGAAPPELALRLARRRVLVVGDLILDRYVRGDVPRISPEAPVPVVHVQGEEERPGGAANVAANVASLAGKALLVGVCGNDAAGKRLKECVTAAGVAASGIRVDRSRPTIEKTRIMARHQQMLRVDREQAHAIDGVLEQRVIGQLRALRGKVDAVILSDYAKGLLSPGVIAAACSLGAEVLVDPKGRDFAKYRGAHGITPNAAEAEAATGCDTATLEGCRAAANQLLRDVGLRWVVITRGARGIYWRTADGQEGDAPTRARSVFDVTGAGDTVIAVLALARAAKLDLGAAVDLANAAAGLVVERLGAASVTPAELANALAHGFSTATKVMTRAAAAVVSRQLAAQGRRVVLTNGCFDLLHAGHVQSLEFARSQGDALFVAVNDDASVRRAKGFCRPVQPLDARLRVLAALACVDAVFGFDDDTPERVVPELSPSVLVKGEDWRDKGVVGRNWVESHGGRVVLAPIVGGHSTSQIIERIRASAGRRR
ncbi:MAG: D-glycero-beta-D-manno-heptose-7-phosphate kinase [Planctomycetes bacterium]|nr:D-glycero-beta-D-manno-heptose-7-phosphate kinase [Planctomycetota bacterium]